MSNDSKTKSIEPKLKFEAKGQTISPFVTKTHPRALERRIRHEEVQQRREAFERDRKSVKFVNDEKKVMMSFEHLYFLLNYSSMQ